MKVSLGSWAFSFGPFADNPIPFEKTVKRLSEAGYDGIEICGFPPHITLDQASLAFAATQGVPDQETKSFQVQNKQQAVLELVSAADQLARHAADRRRWALEVGRRDVQHVADVVH